MEYDKEICGHLFKQCYFDFIFKNNNSDYGKWVARNKGKKRSVVRVIAEWLLEKELPVWLQVDHIDRNTSNNKLNNLRFATAKLNGNNTSSMSYVEEYLKESRLDYGASAYGNRVRTPRIYNKTPEQVELIGHHFHYIMCGEDFYKYCPDSEKEFYSMFKSEQHQNDWLVKYKTRIEHNHSVFEEHKNKILEFTGYKFNTTFEQIYLDK